MQIIIILRNETPIHSSAPGKATISVDGSIGAPNGMPLSRMRTLRVPVISGDGALRTAPLPCVPSNTMRNLLRRSALNTVFDQLRGNTFLDVGAYAAACTGSASGNPEGVPASFGESQAVRNHVFLGLFGGGPRLLKGRLSVDSLYPITKEAMRLIGEGYEDRIVNGSILDIVWTRRVDPIEKLAIENPEQLIANAASEITAWSVKNLDNKAAALSKKASSEHVAEEKLANRGLNAFNAHEVVVPGIDWVWSVYLDSPTMAQAGLVLKAIADIANRRMQVAGGNAKNYGRVKIEDVHLNGHSVWAGRSYTHHADPHFDALAEALDDLSGDDFANFIKTGKNL